MAAGLSLAAFAASAKMKEKKETKEDPVARGRYLVSFTGCNDCHTPWVFNKDLGMPVPDHTRFLSGHPVGGPEPRPRSIPRPTSRSSAPTFTAFKLPFGTVYSANLTPDKETGIGNWTEEMFIDAFRKGLHMGAEGRPVLPPMPWQEYPQHDRRGSQGRLRLPEDHPGHPQPGPRSRRCRSRSSTACSRCCPR